MVIAAVESTSIHYLVQYTKKRDRTVVTYQCWVPVDKPSRQFGHAMTI